MKVSILGCGWLGLPLAKKLIEQRHIVRGSTTRAEKLSELRRAGIEPLWLQLSPELKGIGWDYLLDTEVLIVNIPPRLAQTGSAFHPAQIEHLAALLKNSSVGRVIYVSSTSVYADENRTAVEDDVTTPEQSASPALVEAERIIQKVGKTWLVLRCGGLMGYERIPAKYVSGKKNLTTGHLPVNYLHRDDAVSIIETFLSLSDEAWNQVYNAVAPLHPTRREVYLGSCDPFGFVPPTFEDNVSEPYKVISSEHLQSQTQYSFLYPNPLDFYYSL